MRFKKYTKTYLILGLLLLLSICLYFYVRIIYKSQSVHLVVTQSAFIAIGKRTSINILGVFISATLITIVTQVFQTLTQNTIITPSLIGFDSIFIATQAVLILFSKSNALFSIILSNTHLNFTLSTLIMIFVSVSMYRLILKKNRNNTYLLLLFGITLSTLVERIANYVEVLLNPESFQQLKASTSVTLTNMNSNLVLLVAPVMVWIVYRLYKHRHELDVMLLHQDYATALGIPYIKRMNQYLISISLSMAITTALVGPLTFLGLISINIAKRITLDYRHGVIFVASSLIAILFLLLGQSFVILTGYATPVSVIINLFGGIYLIFLMLKEVKI